MFSIVYFVLLCLDSIIQQTSFSVISFLGEKGAGVGGKIDSVMLCLRGVCFLLLAGNGG